MSSSQVQHTRSRRAKGWQGHGGHYRKQKEEEKEKTEAVVMPLQIALGMLTAAMCGGLQHTGGNSAGLGSCSGEPAAGGRHQGGSCVVSTHCVINISRHHQ